MRMEQAMAWGLLGIVAVLFGTGCQPAEKSALEPQSPEPTEGAHVHDHGETGQHGGHLLHLEPTGAHAEWAHDDDTNTVTVFADEQDLGEIEEVKFVVKIGETTEEFPLQRQGDGWTLSSEALMAHLNMAEAAETSLVIRTADGVLSAKVEAHEHHHH